MTLCNQHLLPYHPWNLLFESSTEAVDHGPEEQAAGVLS
jgi:hypothetical protein